MITGAHSYQAFDAVDTLDRRRSIELFDEILGCVKRRQPPHNVFGFPEYAHALDADNFLSSMLPAEHLERALEPSRIAALRSRVAEFANGASDASLGYGMIGAEDPHHREGADLVILHAVLQHANSLGSLLDAVDGAAAPGCFSTYQVCHDSANATRLWNGHWAVSPAMWRTARGRKDFLVNRIPYSGVLMEMRRREMTVVQALTQKCYDGIARPSLHEDFRNISDDDLTTRRSFIVARHANRANGFAHR